MTHLLIVKDERLLCDLLATTLTDADFTVVKAHSGAEGIRHFRETRPQLTILDLRLPDMSGVSVLRELRYVDGSAPVIMLGGTGSSLLEEEARKLGVVDCLHKNLDLETLVQSVRDTLGEPSTDAAPPRAVFADRTAGD